MSAEPRMVEVRKNVLKQNDVIARCLRERFRNEGILAVSLVSSPGSGKTTFLERTLTLLRPHYRVAALVGDWLRKTTLTGSLVAALRSNKLRPARSAIWKPA